jgi:hypothetical protein
MNIYSYSYDALPNKNPVFKTKSVAKTHRRTVPNPNAINTTSYSSSSIAVSAASSSAFSLSDAREPPTTPAQNASVLSKSAKKPKTISTPSSTGKGDKQQLQDTNSPSNTSSPSRKKSKNGPPANTSLLTNFFKSGVGAASTGETKVNVGADIEMSEANVMEKDSVVVLDDGDQVSGVAGKSEAVDLTEVSDKDVEMFVDLDVDKGDAMDTDVQKPFTPATPSNKTLAGTQQSTLTPGDFSPSTSTTANNTSNSNNSNQPSQNVPATTSYKIFHDENVNSFFRRLQFSPDGSLLVVPAGLYKEAKDLIKSLGASVDGTMSSNDGEDDKNENGDASLVKLKVGDKEKEVGGAGYAPSTNGVDMKHTVYVFTRGRIGG